MQYVRQLEEKEYFLNLYPPDVFPYGTVLFQPIKMWFFRYFLVIQGLPLAFCQVDTVQRDPKMNILSIILSLLCLFPHTSH